MVLGILIVVVGIPAGITWSKGQRAAFFLGFLALGMIWIVAACRLARPTSWAQRLYGPEKLRRAGERFGAGHLRPPESVHRDPHAWLSSAAFQEGRLGRHRPERPY